MFEFFRKTKKGMWDGMHWSDRRAGILVDELVSENKEASARLSYLKCYGEDTWIKCYNISNVK